jgi:ribosomal protein L11 methyltransferase
LTWPRKSGTRNQDVTWQMLYRLSEQLALKTRGRLYRAHPGERVLVLRTAAVFPPGHPSTRLCLDLLKEVLAAGPPSHGLLDVGCGSGALLLAAAAAGLGPGVGVDLSRRAVLVSRENARENGLAAAVHLVQGSTECLRGPFALILANLPLPVQLAKVAELPRLASPDGCLILSGFKDSQEDELLARYREAGWSLRRRCTREEWTIELPPDRSFTWVGWILGPA